MAEDVISKAKTDLRYSLTLTFIDGNRVPNAQAKTFPVECDAF